MSQNFTPPPKLPNRFAVELEFIKPLTIKQRAQIALGYNVGLKIKILIDKRSGDVWESVELTTTQEAAPVPGTPVV